MPKFVFSQVAEVNTQPSQKLETNGIMLYTGFIFGRIKARSPFLNCNTVSEFFYPWASLFHSFTQYGKKEFLKYSDLVLKFLNITLLA